MGVTQIPSPLVLSCISSFLAGFCIRFPFRNNSQSNIFFLILLFISFSFSFSSFTSKQCNTTISYNSTLIILIPFSLGNQQKAYSVSPLSTYFSLLNNEKYYFTYVRSSWSQKRLCLRVFLLFGIFQYPMTLVHFGFLKQLLLPHFPGMVGFQIFFNCSFQDNNRQQYCSFGFFPPQEHYVDQMRQVTSVFNRKILCFLSLRFIIYLKKKVSITVLFRV